MQKQNRTKTKMRPKSCCVGIWTSYLTMKYDIIVYYVSYLKLAR